MSSLTTTTTKQQELGQNVSWFMQSRNYCGNQHDSHFRVEISHTTSTSCHENLQGEISAAEALLLPSCLGNQFRMYLPLVSVVTSLYSLTEHSWSGSIAIQLNSETDEGQIYWCSSVGRASDRHAAEAGSIPWCGKGFFFSPGVNF